MTITIIGTGNVATVLGRMLKKAGHQFLQVYGRNAEQAKALATEWHCSYISEWSAIRTGAEIYLVALSDKALLVMAEELRLPGALVIHTAGSVSMDVLKSTTEKVGVLYPLQTLRKPLQPSAGVPLLIDGSGAEVKRTIRALAESISSQVEEMSDEKRLKLHTAAVIVNNFTNHLYAMAASFCKQEGLNFQMLAPLIRETAERIQRISPEEAMTGPAIRKDQETIERHLGVLNAYPELKTFYQLFTNSIRKVND